MEFRKVILTILIFFGYYNIYAVPKWINDYKKIYSPDKYISGMGISKIKTVAENEARNTISSQFKVHVKSSNTSIEKVKESNDSYNQDFKMVVGITSSVNLELKNIEIAKTYYDKKTDTHYVLAVLNKLKTYKIYQNDVNNLVKEINKLYLDSESEKDLVQRLRILGTIILKNKEIEDINQKLIILDNSRQGNISNNIIIQDVEKQKNEIIEKLTVNIDCEDENIRNVIKEALTSIGLKVIENQGNLTLNSDISVKTQVNYNECSKFL